MVRDEAANMVWGIERTVWLATGTPMPGEEAARETLAYRQRLHPPADPLAPVAAIAYEAMSTVPENWIPFIPVHVPGETGRSSSSGVRCRACSTARCRAWPRSSRGRRCCAPAWTPADLLRARGGGAAGRYPAQPGVPAHPLVRRAPGRLAGHAPGDRPRRGQQRSRLGPDRRTPPSLRSAAEHHRDPARLSRHLEHASAAGTMLTTWTHAGNAVQRAAAATESSTSTAASPAKPAVSSTSRRCTWTWFGRSDSTSWSCPAPPAGK